MAPAAGAPAAGVPAVGDGIGTAVFEWHGVPQARRYILTIVDAVGDIIHREETTATRLAVAVERFAAGMEYSWYVTAVLEDGTALDSEPRRIGTGTYR